MIKEDSLTNAKDYVNYICNKNDIDLKSIPRVAVISYSRNITERLSRKYAYGAVNIGSRVDSILNLCSSEGGKNKFCILNGSIGSPIAAINAEELIAMGVQSILAVGPAGSPIERIQNGVSLNGATIFNVSRAHSCGGTTTHYFKHKNYFHPCKNVFKRISCISNNMGVVLKQGATATTDAIYRETPSFIKNIIGCGCNLIDMECAALFAVAEYRAISSGAILYTTDLVSAENGWHIYTEDHVIQELEETVSKIIEKFVNEN
jgi:uridine phosphorylase